MILAVGNIKGGVGKTTLAVNIAIARASAGRDVLLIDGDEQQTALTFTALRAEKLGQVNYTAVSLQGAALRSQVRQLASKYDDIVIDVGGRDSGSLRAALMVSDTVLIPVQPRSFDLWASEQIAALVAEARELNSGLRALAVLNIADSAGNDNKDALAVLGEVEGLEVLPLAIGRRKSFPNAASAGRAVTEYSPKDNKAIEEINALLASVYAGR